MNEKQDAQNRLTPSATRGETSPLQRVQEFLERWESRRHEGNNSVIDLAGNRLYASDLKTVLAPAASETAQKPVAYVVQSDSDGSIGSTIAPCNYAMFAHRLEELKNEPWVKNGIAKIVPLYLAPVSAASAIREKFIRCVWVVENEYGYGKAMRVVDSDHPRFQVGTRFDYGFLNIAVTEGYIVQIDPVPLHVQHEMNRDSS